MGENGAHGESREFPRMRNAVVAHFAAGHRRVVGLSADDLLRGKSLSLELLVHMAVIVVGRCKSRLTK